MTIEKKSSNETIALWRFEIIFPLLKDNLQSGEKTMILQEIVSRQYEIPGTRKTTICKATIYIWLKSYRKDGIKGLYPKKRKDLGASKALSKEDQEALINFRQREDNQEIPLTTFIEKAFDENIFPPNRKIYMDSVYRFFNRKGLANISKESQKDRRRYEVEAPNDIWQMDFMHAVYVYVVENGKLIKRKAKIAVLIDDYSRLAMAKAYVNETSESLMDLMWESFNKRGMPIKILTDNGAQMVDKRLKLGCAELQIQLTYCKPLDPKPKAKVERFNRSIRDKFLAKLTFKTLTLSEFNQKLNAFLLNYNTTRKHSTTQEIPLERYLNGIISPRLPPHNLPKLFRYSETRKVSEARTIKVGGKLFEVPVGYAKHKIEIRYFYKYVDIEAFFKGISLGFLKPVDFVRNSNGHRTSNEREEQRLCQ
jgi:transposase InsO family protein